MEKQYKQKEIFFVNHLDLTVAEGYTVHVFVRKGRLSFEMRGRDFAAGEGNYAILVEPTLCENVVVSPDFKAVIVYVSDRFTIDNLIKDNQNVKSMLLLLLNPVLNLTENDRRLCTQYLRLLAERTCETGHKFHKEVVETLMAVHTLDLHNIIMRRAESLNFSDRKAKIIIDFITMLHAGSYRKHRDLRHYATALCVADNYLTQICRETTGHSATYWINLFTAGEISFLLHYSQMSLADIAHRFDFSSMSYFSRYVQRTLGTPPSRLQKQQSISK